MFHTGKPHAAGPQLTGARKERASLGGPLRVGRQATLALLRQRQVVTHNPLEVRGSVGAPGGRALYAPGGDGGTEKLPSDRFRQNGIFWCAAFFKRSL